MIGNLNEIGFVELVLFTLSFSFHRNPLVASTPHPPIPPSPPPPLLLTVFTRIMEEKVNKRCGPDAIKGNELSHKSRPLMSTAVGV